MAEDAGVVKDTKDTKEARQAVTDDLGGLFDSGVIHAWKQVFPNSQILFRIEQLLVQLLQVRCCLL